MSVPLGHNIGNSLEVIEACDVLKGAEKDNNLVSLCIDLASEMISMGKNISKSAAIEMVKKSIYDGSAYRKFLELVKYQGGDINGVCVCDNYYDIKSNTSGKLTAINALSFGKLSVMIGAGRKSKEDIIDYSVGIRLNKFVGDDVKVGDLLCRIYTNVPIDEDEVFDFFQIK